jgi:hypothetical protein
MGQPSTRPGPTVAGRRFRLQVKLVGKAQQRERRRQAVAEYLDGWVPLRLVAEQPEGNRCWLWIEAARPLPAAAADDYVRGCPGYVPGSFKMLAD